MSSLERVASEIPSMVPLARYIDGRNADVRRLVAAVKESGDLKFGAKGISYRRRIKGRNRSLVEAAPGQSVKRSRYRCRRTPRRRRKVRKRGTDGNGRARLETHMWHVKRFKMELKWDMLLPTESHGAGPVTASVLRKLHKHCLMHDGSYYRTISIQGRFSDLGRHLRAICDPSAVDVLEESTNDLMPREIEVPLYRAGSFPHGFITAARILAVRSSSDPQLGKLVAWIHPDSFVAVSGILTTAFGDTSAAVECSNDWCRFEFCGGQSHSVLEAVLPGLCNSDAMAAEQGAVFSFYCRDPRCIKPLRPALPSHNQQQNASQESPLSKFSVQECSSDSLFFSEGCAVPPFPTATIDRYRQELKKVRIFAATGDTTAQESQEVSKSLEESKGAFLKRKEQSEGVCPYSASVMCWLVCNAHLPQPCYSLVLPISWAMPFWSEFVRKGARVAGLVNWTRVQQSLNEIALPAQMETEMSDTHAVDAS